MIPESRDASYVARRVHKTTNWVKRNASRYPHHRSGKTYFWTDDDIAAMLQAMQVRPDAKDEPSQLRPLAGRRAS